MKASQRHTAARVPFSTPEPETLERERPPIQSIDDVWCWMNTWGDLEQHDYTPRSGHWYGYRKAIKDMLAAFGAAGFAASQEAWDRWTWSA